MRTGKSLRDASANAELISQALTVQLRTEYTSRNHIPLISTHCCSVWFVRKLIVKLHRSGTGFGTSLKTSLWSPT